MRPLVVEALSIRSFRNLREADVALGPRFNVVSGDNGQGKTSLLEALYVVLTSKSFRATKIEESITFGETSSLVRARILDGDLPRTQAVALRRGGRDLRVDDKRPKSASDFATLSPVVVFHPGELTLSSGSGSERRRLLDRVSLFASPSAADELARYTRAVRSRQAALDIKGGKGHANFGLCKESAQNTCPGWSASETVESQVSVLRNCLRSMWNEGPGSDYSKHGHYTNMTNSGYRKVGCGFAFASGSLWINIPDDWAAEIVVHLKQRGLSMRNWCRRRGIPCGLRFPPGTGGRNRKP